MWGPDLFCTLCAGAPETFLYNIAIILHLVNQRYYFYNIICIIDFCRDAMFKGQPGITYHSYIIFVIRSSLTGVVVS